MIKDLSKITRPVLIIITIIGLIISVELCIVYYNANFNAKAVPSFCSINEVIDCDSVSQTDFSRLLGVPLSLWGLGFYAFILFILVFPFQRFKLFEKFRHPKSYVFSLVTVAVVVSIVLAYISSFVIQKICILCHALYLVNFLLFLFCLTGHSILELYKNTFNDMKEILSDKKWVITFMIMGLIGIGILIPINIFQPFVPKPNQINIPEVDKHNFTIGEIGNTLGSPDAKIIIKEFTDFECPFCAVSNQRLLRLASEVKGVKILHYDFPLNSECNSTVRHSIHQNGCTAAYYARAARKQSKFWDLATLMFENQHDLSEENILKLAESIDLNIEKLKKDAYDPAVKKEIEEDVQRARAYGINGTPSYMIGIKKYEGLVPYSQLKMMVKESL